MNRHEDNELTPDAKAEVDALNAQLELLDKAQHIARSRRNYLLGRPSPPTVAEMTEQFEELLRDQNDCAQYLEPDTQAVSRRIYNESGQMLGTFARDYTHDEWEGDEDDDDERGDRE